MEAPKDLAVAAVSIGVRISSSGYWLLYLKVALGLADVTLAELVEVAVVVDEALSFEAEGSLMGAAAAVVAVVVVAAVAAADSNAVHRQRNSFGLSKVGTGDTRTWVAAFAAAAGRKAAHLGHGFEMMLLTRENLTEEYGIQVGKVVAFG